jgi:hypothetical protein
VREELSSRPVGARRVGWKVGRGERARIGLDRVVTGLTANNPVAAGDEVVAEISPLGRVGLRIA